MDASIAPETDPVGIKKKQPSRTASLDRCSDIANQVNVVSADLSITVIFHPVSQRSSNPIS